MAAQHRLGRRWRYHWWYVHVYLIPDDPFADNFTGKRCPLKYTRAILDAIHSGELAKVEYETYDTFNLSVPKTCPGVPDELLNPAKSWTGTASFKDEVTKLGGLFQENFKKYSDEATPEVIKAGPQV